MLNFLTNRKKREAKKSNNWLFGTMLAFGFVGLVASFVLAVERNRLLENPDAILSCSLNIVLNCAGVMQTWQASVFGFSNVFIGLMGFSVVVTVAAVGLAGAKLPRWFWISALVGYGLGAIFAQWLFFSSVFVIEVLCPWCLFVTFSTIILLATITRHVLLENTFKIKKSTNKKIQSFLEKDYDKVLAALWVVALVAVVLVKFSERLWG